MCFIPCFLLIIFRVLLFPGLLVLYKKLKMKYFHLYISGSHDFTFHASIFVLHFALLHILFFFSDLSFFFRFWKCFRSLKSCSPYILFFIWPHIIFVFPLFLFPPPFRFFSHYSCQPSTIKQEFLFSIKYIVSPNLCKHYVKVIS